jgi:transcription termination factor NusB
MLRQRIVSIEGKMYEELDSFERALQHFGTRVEIISAMEIAKKLSSEDAYQMIKGELKELKKVRKKMKQEP